MEEIDFYEISGFENAKKKSLDLLARKRYAKNELLNKLLKYDINESAAEAACIWAEQYGFLNDFEYAKSYISDAVRVKKKGIRKIFYELYLKGIDKNTAEDALSEIKDEINIQENIDSLIKKRLKDPGDKKQLQSTVRFLLSRGYEFSDIKNGIKEYTEEFEFEQDY